MKPYLHLFHSCPLGTDRLSDIRSFWQTCFLQYYLQQLPYNMVFTFFMGGSIVGIFLLGEKDEGQ